MSKPLIPALIEGKDNIEIVRDNVAAILALELQNQRKLAEDAGRYDDAHQYDIKVYLENARPYEMASDNPTIRLVNIVLPKVRHISGARTGSQQEKAVFWLDCAATGNDAASKWNEKSAACRAWAVSRLVRDILMSDAYLYLGMRGVVGSRNVTNMETGTPQGSGAGEAVQFVVVRLTLEVQFGERCIEVDAPKIEGIDFEVDPENGEVVANDN